MILVTIMYGLAITNCALAVRTGKHPLDRATCQNEHKLVESGFFDILILKAGL